MLRCVALATTLLASGVASAGILKNEYQDFESAVLIPYTAADSNAFSALPSALGGGLHIIKGFEGISQYDVASVARNFIPPDTIGAVGTTQYLTFVNGGVAVYEKATGNRLSFQSDLSFWQGLGRSGANGDSRVQFDKASNRWIALSFASSVSQIQIAVSDTANALGPWNSTVFTGFSGFGFGATADYPTLAIDNNAVYIGTNNFAPTSMGGPNSFRGTTLNIIPKGDLFGAGAPTADNRAVVVTPFTNSSSDDDRGFAIQGVNTASATTTGRLIAASLFTNDVVRYDINGVDNLATATLSPTTFLGTRGYGTNEAGRQPNLVPDVDINLTDAIFNNDRVVDTLDQRIGSSVTEVNGRIYSVYTITPRSGDHTYIRTLIVDATTNEILYERNIGDGVHDYYQGSIAVNSAGTVVVGYDRSGSEAGTGNITFAAQTFRTSAKGKLVAIGSEEILKVSLVDDYHNGSLDGQVAARRQRWGDYSSVTVDPTDENYFWAIGEFAREYNDLAGGHPGGTGGSRWSTWISELYVNTQVPEPSALALMALGLGFVGMTRRRPATVA